MPKRSNSQLPRREGRPQMPPPAPVGDGVGIPGNSIFEEFRGPTGMLLWQSLRDVLLWTHTPPGRRGELFRPGRERARLVEIVRAGVDAELIGPLTTVARVLGSSTPPEPREVAAACRSVSQWADGHGLLRTALWFAQGAALVVRADAAAANRVGRLARSLAEYARAETWFRRAIGLARRSGDGKSYSKAYIGLGNLYLQRGELPQARDALLKAYRTARRASLRQVQAMALHDLFCISAHLGRVEEAQEYARGAFRAYGPRNSRQVVLAHDVAWHWLLQGSFARALSVFQAVQQHLSRPKERILVLSNIARAAGGAGDRPTFLQAWTDVWTIVNGYSELDGASEALVNLAYGAAKLGDRERVESAAKEARLKATGRQEQQVLMATEQVLIALDDLTSIDAGRPAIENSTRTADADALAAEFVRVLRARVAGS